MLIDVLLVLSVLNDYLKWATLGLECHIYEKVYRFLVIYKFVYNQLYTDPFVYSRSVDFTLNTLNDPH